MRIFRRWDCAMIVIVTISYYYYVPSLFFHRALHFHYVTEKVNIISTAVWRVIYYCKPAHNTQALVRSDLLNYRISFMLETLIKQEFASHLGFMICLTKCGENQENVHALNYTIEGFMCNVHFEATCGTRWYSLWFYRDLTCRGNGFDHKPRFQNLKPQNENDIVTLV